MNKEITKSPTIESKTSVRTKKPSWLRVKLPVGEKYKKVRSLVDQYQLHTICESGNCPNMGECWGAGTATFMILGNICTRSCSFCAVATGRPLEADPDEPRRVAEAIQLMGVKHAVLTSVDRDELKDGGAAIWAATVNAVREMSPGTTMETLLPDFKGNLENLQQVLDTKPEVVSHNMETVKRLTRLVRPQAKYDRSLEVLQHIRSNNIRTKSGIMLGLGEKKEEVVSCMEDLLNAGVEVLTVGQYLQPTKMHIAVDRFAHPDEFAYYKEVGESMGFDIVESSPLVRSSYHAERHL